MKVRLFFALWPADVQRARLSDAACVMHEACGGRPVQRQDLHQTLLFLGGIEADRASKVMAFTDMVRIRRFTLRFGTIGYWRHNRILWAAPFETPQSLSDLVAALQREARAAGLRCEERVYASHVTLIRDAQAPTQTPPLAFEWPVKDYALVKSASSMQGVRYEVIARGVLE